MTSPVNVPDEISSQILRKCKESHDPLNFIKEVEASGGQLIDEETAKFYLKGVEPKELVEYYKDNRLHFPDDVIVSLGEQGDSVIFIKKLQLPEGNTITAVLITSGDSNKQTIIGYVKGSQTCGSASDKVTSGKRAM